MEIYILDDKFRRDQVIDRFESLIWTERYSSFGDFQLVVHSTSEALSTFTKGLRLGLRDSNRVMTIENLEDAQDEDGRKTLKVTGRSLESVLETRAVRSRSMGGLNTEPVYTLATPAPPMSAVRTIVRSIAIEGRPSVSDAIPMLTGLTLYPAYTIAEPGMVLSFEIPPTNLYDWVKSVADAYGFGFRLYKGPDNQTLYFNAYTGDDRTSGQTAKTPVIFSPDLDNMSRISELSSIEKERTVAVVIAKQGSMFVYANDEVAALSGLDRKSLVVEASDIALPPGTDLTDAMTRRGKEALSAYRQLQALDGEIPKTSKYIYGVDYNLGDLVEIRTDSGQTQRMRVTEQIFVDDAQGERSYPTLKVDSFVTPGSWYSWDFNGVWDGAGDVVWDSLP